MNPYKTLPAKSFWRTAVSDKSLFDLQDVYTKKFEITQSDRIATAGSCFAQHISKSLRKASFNYVDYEPAPWPMPTESRSAFGYGLFSARYGNIYTVRQLLQMVERAFGNFTPAESHWEYEGRFYDPYRPTIEKDGFNSLAELVASRETHFKAVRQLFERSSIIIFTLGLTESWHSRIDGAVFPLCPGTTPGGRFDPNSYSFKNFGFMEIKSDFDLLITKVRSLNTQLRFLLTVSPVPLTATATSDHVLVATTYSKSILRAVAGELTAKYPFVDYFPSYELINSAPMRGTFFQPNLREVNSSGVELVMRHFFAQHLKQTEEPLKNPTEEMDHNTTPPADGVDDIVCEELLLDQGT